MMSNLKIAIQKSGRLSEKSLKLLEQCGIKFSNGERKLKSEALNFPCEVLFLRDDDIPQYVEQGVAHAGILGENVVNEKNKEVEIVTKLGFAQCRLSIAIPRDENYIGPAYFQHKKIATSYPRILQQYLDQQAIKATIEELSGSVEIATAIGLADGIADLVSTGSTLQINGLKEVETIMKSEAVLIANKKITEEMRHTLNKLLFRIRSVLSAEKNKYILLNAPNERVEDICYILPGMKSPTILPLATPGWSSLHSVISEDQFWHIIDQLKDLGAEGILVTPIEKLII